MSRCSQFHNLIWDAAETGVHPPLLCEHLGNCVECREKLAGIEKAVEGFAVLRRVAAPDPTRKVWARVTDPRRRSWLVPSLAAGSLVLAAAICFFLSLRLAPVKPSVRAVQVVNRQAEGPTHKEKTMSRVTNLAHLARMDAPQTPRRHPRHTTTMAYRPRLHLRHRPTVDKQVRVAMREMSELERPCMQSTTIVALPRQIRAPVVTNLSPTYYAQAVPETVDATHPARSHVFD